MLLLIQEIVFPLALIMLFIGKSSGVCSELYNDVI